VLKRGKYFKKKKKRGSVLNFGVKNKAASIYNEWNKKRIRIK